MLDFLVVVTLLVIWLEVLLGVDLERIYYIRQSPPDRQILVGSSIYDHNGFSTTRCSVSFRLADSALFVASSAVCKHLFSWAVLIALSTEKHRILLLAAGYLFTVLRSVEVGRRVLQT